MGGGPLATTSPPSETGIVAAGLTGFGKFCLSTTGAGGSSPPPPSATPATPAAQSPSPSTAQAHRLIHHSSANEKRILGPHSLSRVNRSRTLAQNYGPPFPAVNRANTRASPARRVMPRRSAHSSSGIKYLRVSPNRSRNSAGVALPSSERAASRPVRKDSNACGAA